jgi:hypothetical protein
MQNKPQKFLPSLYGGIVIATISTIPGLNLINCFCCAGIMLGGIVAVYFYRRDLSAEMSPLTAGDGAALGALSGVLAAFLSLVLYLILYALFGNIAERLVYEIMRSILDSVDIPPEASEAIEEALREALERGLTPLVLFLRVVQELVLFTIFGIVGGLIGYAIFKRKGPQAQSAAPAV